MEVITHEMAQEAWTIVLKYKGYPKLFLKFFGKRGVIEKLAEATRIVDLYLRRTCKNCTENRNCVFRSSDPTNVINTCEEWSD